MKIRLHIERLVIDATTAGTVSPHRMSAAMRGELTRLLADQGIPASLRAGGAKRRIRSTGALRSHAAGANALGHSIAAALYRTLGGATERRR